MHDLRSIAVDEFVNLANNAKLSEIISAKEDENKNAESDNDPDEEYVIF